MMQRFREWLYHSHILHRGESVSHLFYLGFAFVEGHGLHAIAAGIVAIFLVLQWALHSEGL